MTNYKNHLLFGVILWIAFCYFLNLFQHPLFVISILVAAIGSLFSDLDSQSSKINNLVELSLAGLILLVVVILYFTRDINLLLPVLFVCGALILVLQLLKHRGVLHSAAFGFGIAAFVYLFFSHILGAAFFVGFASHLLADKHF